VQVLVSLFSRYLGKGFDAISGAANHSYGITKAITNAAEVLKTDKIKK